MSPESRKAANFTILLCCRAQQTEKSRESMECTVRWTSGMTFLAETASNHVVAMDGAPEGGGRNLAPRPMEMVLLGTGGCTAYDVVVILTKSGHPITASEVKLTPDPPHTDP